MAPTARRIGILAGGGTLPLEFARSAAARGELVHVVAIEGAADAEFASLPVTRVGMGQVGHMLRAFRKAQATDIVIIGPARRPDLRKIKPDAGFFLSLPAILRILSSGGDDGVLSGVVRFFEAKGFRVLGPTDVAPETLAPVGPLTSAKPGASDMADIALGFAIIRRLGDLDVGQAVIVGGGRVEAIEGAEGTDAMLARVAARRGAATGARGGVLVKRPKPGQELRVDMPSIGPGSVTGAEAAGLAGIAVHAGDVLVAERAELVRRAEAAGIFVAGVSDGPDEVAAAQGRPGPVTATRLGRHAPADREKQDLSIAAAVMTRLARYGCGAAVSVAKGHVLAVEAGGEGAAAVIGRTARVRLRSGTLPRQAGVVLVPAGGIDLDTVAAVSHARLAGIALSGPAGGPDMDKDIIAACNRGRLFLVALAATTGDAS